MAREKILKIEIGDVIIRRHPTGEVETKGKNKGMKIYCDTVWDVIKVNKKSIILQEYPTYRIKKLKR